MEKAGKEASALTGRIQGKEQLYTDEKHYQRL